LVSVLFFTLLFLACLPPVSAQAPTQSPPATANATAAAPAQFRSLFVKRDGKWLVAEIREYAAPV
jgi:hypothetical protein